MIFKTSYKLFIVLSLFFLSISVFGEINIENSKLDLSQFDFSNNQLIELNANWLFKSNELLTYEDVERIDTNLKVPGRFSEKYENTLYGTYAIKVDVGNYRDVLGLRIDTISSSYNLFINSKLMIESGVVGSTRKLSRPKRVPTVTYFQPPASEFWIVIQVSDFYNYRGGIWYPIEMGSMKAISRKEKISTISDIFIFGVLIFVSIYHFILFLFRTKNRENLTISGFSSAILIRNSLMGERIFLYLFDDINFDLMLKLQTLTIAYALYFYISFLDKIFSNLLHPKILKFNKYLVIILTFLVSITGIKVLIYILFLLEIILILEAFYLSFATIKEFYKGERRLIYIIAGVIVLIAAVINDILLDHLLINSIYLTPIGLVLFMLFNSLLTAKNLSNTLNKVEDNKIEIENLNDSLLELNKNLEEKVIERTQKIENQKNELEWMNDELISQNELINEKNINITNSINYAKKIQTALLPSEEKIREYYKNFFILFLPKDIVSGDFYWFHVVENKEIIIQADCTGHGVPGSLISMLGNVSLNRNIIEEKITNPAEILKNLDSSIKSLLNPSNTPYGDGMDISISVIDRDNDLLTFAGARNSILYIKKDDSSINELKGTKKSIGQTLKKAKRNYENISLKLSEISHLYIFSDGYTDQLNSNGKMFMKSRLKELLSEIHNKDFKEQRLILLEKHLEFRKDTVQIDDISLIGLKL